MPPSLFAADGLNVLSTPKVEPIKVSKHTLKRLTKLNKRWRNVKSGVLKPITNIIEG